MYDLATIVAQSEIEAAQQIIEDPELFQKVVAPYDEDIFPPFDSHISRDLTISRHLLEQISGGG